jgi:SWIM zinc finger
LVVITRERIEGLAPDQASLAAALKLLKPSSWPVLAANGEADVLWGECQGSGATPYRVVVSPEDVGYKCTCPSRKFPCKHVLAVLWLRVDKPERFETGQPPSWVDEWRVRRRSGAGRPAGKPTAADDGAAKARPSLDAAFTTDAETETLTDPKAAARAAAQRERVRMGREAGVLAGLDDLDRWTLDQLAQGMATFAQRSQQSVRTLSRRLVDAKAGGLAARLDLLAAELFRVPEGQRADFAIEQVAALTLIASAYRRMDHLPVPLREDARRAVGWSVKREELLADAAAPRADAAWIVAANLSEVQPDKLRRLETWLMNATPTGGAPRTAVLIDFVPVSGGAYGFSFEPGESIEGEIVFYPSAAPLRGLLASRRPASAPVQWPEGHADLGAAMEEFAARLATLPWLDAWPLLAEGVAIRTAGKGMVVLTDEHGSALTLERSQADALMPMIGLEIRKALFTWDGRLARMLALDTPVGQWHAS